MGVGAGGGNSQGQNALCLRVAQTAHAHVLQQLWV